MHIILIPGFWLDGSSWDGVTPVLEAAGHRVRALTLPGLESPDADRRGIRRADHFAAVIAAIDAADGPVVLVGHSGGGALAYAAADARPDRIARLVFVDSGPLAVGQSINADLPVVDGEIPLPDWSVFTPDDLRDLDEDLRRSFRARAIPHPAAVASDPQEPFVDDRRRDIPATIVCCEMPSEALRGWIAEGHPFVAEAAAMRRVDLVDLPTGHWPQFTRPRDLADVLLEQVSR